MSNIFDEINQNEENRVEEKIETLPQAYQVRTVKGGREEIVDTFVVDKIRQIVPIDKAKAKARLMKKAFPNQTFFVVEINHTIVGTY